MRIKFKLWLSLYFIWLGKNYQNCQIARFFFFSLHLANAGLAKETINSKIHILWLNDCCCLPNLIVLYYLLIRYCTICIVLQHSISIKKFLRFSKFTFFAPKLIRITIPPPLPPPKKK